MCRVIEGVLRWVGVAVGLGVVGAAGVRGQDGFGVGVDAEAGVAFGAAGEDAERELEGYLGGLGLQELRAEHMAARLASMDGGGEERDALVERLARVYAGLLETAGTIGEQRVWERRAESLLDEAEGSAAGELRLGLARAAYGRVEEVAEAWVLRTVGEAERGEALRRLGEIEGRLLSVAELAGAEVARFERLEESAPDTEQERIGRRLADAERRRSIARYLSGWCAAYMAELERDGARAGEHARRGLVHFGYLLNAVEGGEPSLDRLRASTLSFEHVARSALVVTTLLGRVGETTRALRWLDELEAIENLHAAAREQLFLRRAIVLARGGEWRWLGDVVEERRAGRSALAARPMTTGEARRVAVLAFEAIGGGADASSGSALAGVRDAAIADLVAAGELGHVLDLADRYGFRSLGEDSFVADQVRGLVVYGEAREAHRAWASEREGASASDPVGDALIGETYRRAAFHFGAALGGEDASSFPRALANTAMLRGLALFYAGAGGDGEEEGEAGLLAAATLFIEASDGFEAGEAERAAEALWLAIRSYDLQLEAMGEGDPASDAIRLDREALIGRFLARHPGHERAAALRLRRALEGDLPIEEKLALLAEVPASSALWEHARRQASRLAYEGFREASGRAREFAASRYVGLAQPLLVLDRRRAEGGDGEAAALASMRARRMVEAILAGRVPDLEWAERTLGVLRGLIASGLVDGAELAAELTYREAEIALARGDGDRAEALLAGLVEGDSRFAGAARRLFYRHALRAFEQAQERGDDEARAVAAERLARVGGALIGETDAMEVSERPAGMLSVYAGVGDALSVLWSLREDGGARDRALGLYERVLEAMPRNPRALAGAAEMAEASGLMARALEYRRALLAGAERGSAGWFEAKYRHVRVLAEVDPGRAALVLEQHEALYPGWGPEPWGDGLRELAGRVGAGDGGAG